jgi:hypothetical protein
MWVSLCFPLRFWHVICLFNDDDFFGVVNVQIAVELKQPRIPIVSVDDSFGRDFHINSTLTFAVRLNRIHPTSTLMLAAQIPRQRYIRAHTLLEMMILRKADWPRLL